MLRYTYFSIYVKLSGLRNRYWTFLLHIIYLMYIKLLFMYIKSEFKNVILIIHKNK